MIVTTRLSVMMSVVLCVSSACAQNEGRIASDFRREGKALQSCKTFKLGSIASCGETLVTGQPLHIAVGSLAPQNGIGAGLAFVEHKNLPSEWRLNWNADAVGTGNGSWRAGAYMKAYRLPGGPIRVIYPGPSSSPTKKSAPLYRSAPVFNLYAQAISLQHVDYFGLGPASTPAGHSVFGIRQTIVGVNALIPVSGKANISLLGELNGRFPSIRGNHTDTYPSIEQVYNEATAPGLTQQAAFIQAGEGVRLRPSLLGDRFRLNYILQFQQFIAPSASQYSFRRWSADFEHQIPLYRNVRLTAARDQNGPDDCSSSSSPTDVARPCPHISLTQNLEGSISIRLLMTGSIANAGHVVPFYFDPTIGGSDINGAPMLASYPDYRFRAPNLILLRETFEHSIGKLPIGFIFSIDEAKVGLRRGDIEFTHLQHTFSTGLTVRAGGLPVVSFLFSWGGNEGNHTTASVNNALLGGSSRPSLF